MPQAEDSHVIVEVTHHTLHAMRVVKGTIEAGGSCVLENKASLEAMLDSVAPTWKTEVVKASATVWPDNVAWHLSNDTEAMLDRTGEALRAIAASIQGDDGGALAYAACGSAHGGAGTADGTDKWVLASSPSNSLEKVSSVLGQLKLVSDGIGPAAFPRIFAISAALRAAGKGSVALWDLGSERSHLVLVTSRGVEGVAACEVGLDSVFQAIQQALRLKFRGAGERLFFNETYDFADPGPKVAATVGPKLKAALGQLAPAGVPPMLACIGLTAKQAWFLRELAAAAGTSAWEPEMGAVASELGLRFADPSVEASFSAASLGILGQAAAISKGSEAWQPTWVAAEAMEAEAPPAPVAPPEPEPEPV